MLYPEFNSNPNIKNQGKITAPRSLLGTLISLLYLFFLDLILLAGLGAGVAEAIIAVTPSETIKYGFATMIISKQRV